MKLLDKLFRGAFLYMPKWAWWLLLGLIGTSLLKWGDNSGHTSFGEWLPTIIGFLLAAFSVYYNLKNER